MPKQVFHLDDYFGAITVFVLFFVMLFFFAFFFINFYFIHELDDPTIFEKVNNQNWTNTFSILKCMLSLGNGFISNSDLKEEWLQHLLVIVKNHPLKFMSSGKLNKKSNLDARTMQKNANSKQQSKDGGD